MRMTNPQMSANNAVGLEKFHERERGAHCASSPSGLKREIYDRDFGAGVGKGVADGVAGAAGPATVASVTMFSDFSSSGLKMNSLSLGVSMACTHICGLMPMSLR